jgi:ubiquinone biosynthesis protein UbiJ
MEAENAALKVEVTELEQQHAELKARLSRLEQSSKLIPA